MSDTAIRLIVGLCNPGERYAKTRHNAGAWFVSLLAQRRTTAFKQERKFLGTLAKVSVQGGETLLFLPSTFMNESGRAVAAVAKFYKVPTRAILIVHDELDLPTGCSRFKFAGGHGGHNGLRSIIQFLSSADFWRLRIGIDHPGEAALVTNYVLTRPSPHQQQLIGASMEKGVSLMSEFISGARQLAVQQLHEFKPVVI